MTEFLNEIMDLIEDLYTLILEMHHKPLPSNLSYTKVYEKILSLQNRIKEALE